MMREHTTMTNSQGEFLIKNRRQLAGAVPSDNRFRSLQKNLHIEPRRTEACVLQIQADHIIKSDSAAPLDLP